MSLEQALTALVHAIATQVVQQMQAGQPVQQPTPPPAAPPQQPVYQAPPPVQQMAPPPMQPPAYQPPMQQAAPQGYPFHDNVTASAWISDIWNKACAVNEDVARAEFGTLLAQLGTADLNSLTPAHFPTLYGGGQALKAKLGIPG